MKAVIGLIATVCSLSVFADERPKTRIEIPRQLICRENDNKQAFTVALDSLPRVVTSEDLFHGLSWSGIRHDGHYGSISMNMHETQVSRWFEDEYLTQIFETSELIRVARSGEVKSPRGKQIYEVREKVVATDSLSCSAIF